MKKGGRVGGLGFVLLLAILLAAFSYRSKGRGIRDGRRGDVGRFMTRLARISAILVAGLVGRFVRCTGGNRLRSTTTVLCGTSLTSI